MAIIGFFVTIIVVALIIGGLVGVIGWALWMAFQCKFGPSADELARRDKRRRDREKAKQRLERIKNRQRMMKYYGFTFDRDCPAPQD